MKAWYAISVLFLCFACFFAGRYSVEKQIEVVKETDTINKPVPEPSYILDVEEIELPYPIFVYQIMTSNMLCKVRVKVGL